MKRGIWRGTGSREKEQNNTMGQWSHAILSLLHPPISSLPSPDLLETRPQLCAPLSSHHPSLKPTLWPYEWPWGGGGGGGATECTVHVCVCTCVCDSYECGCVWFWGQPGATNTSLPSSQGKRKRRKRKPPRVWHLKTDKERSHLIAKC